MKIHDLERDLDQIHKSKYKNPKDSIPGNMDDHKTIIKRLRKVGDEDKEDENIEDDEDSEENLLNEED